MKKEKVLISLKSAVKYINELHQWDPIIEGKDLISIKHLYNCICSKKIKRYGARKSAQLDREEIEAIFGPKRAI